MDVLNLITAVGGIILIVGYLPQIRKLLTTENTEGINNAFWYLIFSAVAITAINLITTDAPVLLQCIQIANATLAAGIIILVHVYRREAVLMILPAYILAYWVIFTYQVPMELTQSAASLMIVIAYVSQLITLIKTHSAKGVSASLYLIIAIGLAIMATKMFVSEVSVHIIITEIVNIILLLSCAWVARTQQTRHKKKGESNIVRT